MIADRSGFGLSTSIVEFGQERGTIQKAHRDRVGIMTKIADKTVLITGAAMGMGRLHAQRAVREKARHIVLWDLQEASLESTADELRRDGASVHTEVVDISSVDAIERAAERTLREVGLVQILFNNAGVVKPGDFLGHGVAGIERTFRVNTLGVMHVTRLFLPGMIASPSSHLVNISSASALMPIAYGSVYAASKWAVYCWSESLRLELEDQGHRHVKVTTVCPSFVGTGMFEGGKAPPMTRFLTPEGIVDSVWRAVSRDRILVIEPAMARSILPLRALLPTRVYDWIGRHIFRTHESLKGLTGRQTPGERAAPPREMARS